MNFSLLIVRVSRDERFIYVYYSWHFISISFLIGAIRFIYKHNETSSHHGRSFVPFGFGLLLQNTYQYEYVRGKSNYSNKEYTCMLQIAQHIYLLHAIKNYHSNKDLFLDNFNLYFLFSFFYATIYKFICF